MSSVAFVSGDASDAETIRPPVATCRNSRRLESRVFMSLIVSTVFVKGGENDVTMNCRNQNQLSADCSRVGDCLVSRPHHVIVVLSFQIKRL